MRKKGVFITLEGVEGAGKSTQLLLLSNSLKKLGLEIVVTREPGGTALGKKIRALLLSVTHDTVSPMTELLLYLSDRVQHVSNVILPALEKGKIVLCDRFSDATVAYQGYGRGLSLGWIQKGNAWVLQGAKPSLTFLFDLSVELGLKRVAKRSLKEDRLEAESIRFHKRVRHGYLTLARRESKRFYIVDASKSVETVQREVFNKMKKFLRERKWL